MDNSMVEQSESCRSGYIVQPLATLFFPNLFYGSREPLPRTYKPEADAIHNDDSYGNDGVIECLRINWICLRKNEDNRYAYYPQDGGDGYGEGEWSKMEGTTYEAFSVNNAEGNWYTIRDVETDGRNARRCRESN